MRLSGVLDQLVDLAWRLEGWSYLLLFLGATLESSAFLGFVVPGETLVIVAGVMASTGMLNPVAATSVAAIGGIIGDSIGYEMGRRLGRPWLEGHGGRFGIRRRVLARVDELFARHGGLAVFLGRFVGLLRALAPFVAGASRMRYPRFLAYNVAGGILWAIVMVGLGYSLGASWQVAERWIGRLGLVLGVVVVAALAYALRRTRRPAPGAGEG
ncbi:MAG: DedA family protein [Candidatus Rokubacteria bacterium]|nr:DedA family protein [Candidatus Rokubacteria bacterium]